MRVIQVINSLATGGAEKLILDSILLYRKKKVEVDLLVLKDENYPFLEELKSNSNCKIHIIGVGSVYNPMHIFKIIKVIRKYDIAHVHLFPSQYYVVLAKMFSFSKIKLIFTEHSTSNRRIRNRFFKYIDKFFYGQYDKIVCITKEVYRVLLDHTDLQANKFVTINNGINIELFLNSEKDSMFIRDSLRDVWLIQVSSFQEPKDQQTVIKSLKRLPDNFKLMLVGDGVLKQNCIDLVSDLKLKNRVDFLGLRNDIPLLLQKSDIVILSSKYEGLSLSSIEGMASGKPFLASNVPGLKDVVEGAGVLFECGNEQELASKIMELINNEVYYNKVVNSCLIRAKQFDIQIMIQKYTELYQEVYES